ncbi:hypothetical protein [Nocardiopsis gilva]|uniref:hypothetical protein n=1 Tax=Nocardiopsis gilva TaxID=280236 RepID=UPI001E4A5B77|nr:hypothetical protein [Nocardiopsis gilva]
MPSPLTRVPPVVANRGAGGYAYLLAWVRTPSGLLARITWVETYVGEHGQQWRWEVAEVPATKVEQVSPARAGVDRDWTYDMGRCGCTVAPHRPGTWSADRPHGSATGPALT